jgi:hypothetical protein
MDEWVGRMRQDQGWAQEFFPFRFPSGPKKNDLARFWRGKRCFAAFFLAKTIKNACQTIFSMEFSLPPRLKE